MTSLGQSDGAALDEGVIETCYCASWSAETTWGPDIGRAGATAW